MRQIASGRAARRRPAALASLLLAAVIGGEAFAMDSEGRFAIEGAGRQTCAAFTASADAGSADFRLYVGWVEGYLTGLNHYRPQTYDITPWQTTGLVVSLLQRFCERNPETRFVDAIGAFTNEIAGDRLEREAQVLRIERGDRGTLLPVPVVEAVADELRARGLMREGDGGGAAFAEGLARFQREAGLDDTGFPDQRTLYALLMGKTARER